MGWAFRFCHSFFSTLEWSWLGFRDGESTFRPASMKLPVVFVCAVVCHVHLSLAAVSCSATRRPPLAPT
jgi:hypothetical protein